MYISKYKIQIEAGGRRFIDFFDAEDHKLELTLPYELCESFVKDLQVCIDKIDARNQRAYTAVQRILKLETVNFGTVAECLKGILSESVAQENLEITPDSESLFKVRLKKSLNLPEEFGMFEGEIFLTKSSSKQMVSVKARNGKFVSIRGQDFEFIHD